MAGTPRSALHRSEACRAATETALVGGATAGEYLQAFVFNFLGQVSSTNTSVCAVLSLVLTTSLDTPMSRNEGAIF